MGGRRYNVTIENNATASRGDWSRSAIVFEALAESPAGAVGPGEQAKISKDATRYGSRAALRRIAELCELMATRRARGAGL